MTTRLFKGDLMRSMALLALAAGCGTADPDSNLPDGNSDQLDVATRYLPWRVGSVWSYRLTDPSNLLPPRDNALTTVEAQEDIGGSHAGTVAFRLRIERLGGFAITHQGYEGALAVRYALTDYDLAGTMIDVQSMAPYRLKLDESALHMISDAVYTETFTITTTDSTGTRTNAKNENWQVISMTEEVTVTAGTFTTMHVRRTNPAGDSDKTKDYWFARGTGKVKETGGGQDEELVSFTP